MTACLQLALITCIGALTTNTGILRSIILSALAPHRLTLTPDPLPALGRVSLAPRLAGGEGAEDGDGDGDGLDPLSMLQVRCV